MVRLPTGFQTAVGTALGLSVAASIAASWDGPPTDYEMLCLAIASIGAMAAGVATAPGSKKPSKVPPMELRWR